MILLVQENSILLVKKNHRCIDDGIIMEFWLVAEVINRMYTRVDRLKPKTGIC